MTLASCCSWADWFESYLVANPKTGFICTSCRCYVCLLEWIKNRTYWLNRVIGSYCEIEKTFSLILIRFNEKKICSNLNIWQLHFLKSITWLQLPGLNSGNVNLTHVMRNLFMPYAKKTQISLRIHSLCYSGSRQYHIYSCYIRKFRTPVSFCSWADRFMPYMYLVAHFRNQSFLIPWLMIKVRMWKIIYCRNIYRTFISAKLN